MTSDSTDVAKKGSDSESETEKRRLRRREAYKRILRTAAKNLDHLTDMIAYNIGKEPDYRLRFFSDSQTAIKDAAKEAGQKLNSKQLEYVSKRLAERLPMPFLTKAEIVALVNDTTDKSNEGYRKVRQMSEVLFGLGVFIIAAVFALDIYGILAQLSWQNLVASSGVIGGVGVLTIFQATHKLPDKLETAIANLAQIKFGFYGFFDQLTALMGVKPKSAAEALKISKEIKAATNEAMKNIQKYCEPPS